MKFDIGDRVIHGDWLESGTVLDVRGTSNPRYFVSWDDSVDSWYYEHQLRLPEEDLYYVEVDCD